MEAWQNFHHMNICTFVPKNIKSFIFLASNIAPILECWIHRGECKPAQSSERFGWVLIYQYFVHQNWHLFSYLLLPMNVFVFFFHSVADNCIHILNLHWSWHLWTNPGLQQWHGTHSWTSAWQRSSENEIKTGIFGGMGTLWHVAWVVWFVLLLCELWELHSVLLIL